LSESLVSGPPDAKPRRGRRPGSTNRPRGVEANRTLVNIWDVLARAEKPMTIEEIADALSDRGLRDNSDALILYKQAHSTHGELDALWNNEAPPREIMDVAWVEWVAKWVDSGRINKTFIATSDPGVSLKSRYAIRRYSANRDNPPMVYEWQVSTERHLVPYDPEKRDQANQGHTAGIDFLRGLADLDLKRKRDRVPDDVKKLLEKAEQAIRARPSE
jgi:hypothetical protein